MTRSQRIVAIGAISGVTAMLLTMYALYRLLPPASGSSTLADRIGYALVANLIASLPLLAAVASVGNARATSEAIDPTLGKESRSMMIDGRVADNTLQQFALFSAATLALSVNLSGTNQQIIGAAAGTFVAARILFWIGYRIDPLYRAAGFAATFYLNLGLIIAALWLAIR
jgi:uncharacterized MAPEG superfamily protein